MPGYLVKHSGVSVRMFLDEDAFESVNWVKQIALPSVGGLQPNSWKSEWNQKADLPTVREGFLLSDCFQTGIEALFCLLTQTSVLPGSRAGLWTRATPVVLLALRTSDLDWNETIGPAGSPAWQLTLRSWDLSAFVITSVFLLINLFILTHAQTIG